MEPRTLWKVLLSPDSPEATGTEQIGYPAAGTASMGLLMVCDKIFNIDFSQLFFRKRMLQNGPADPALPQDTNDRKKRFEVYSAANEG